MSSFQAGDTKSERCLPKNQHTQRKWLNFENWCSGKLSKSAKIRLSKSIFYVKNHWNLSQFFLSLKNTNLRAHWHFLIMSIFKTLYFLKWGPISDSSPLHQFAKFKTFLWLCWFFGKNISSFVSLAWKLDPATCITIEDIIVVIVP